MENVNVRAERVWKEIQTNNLGEVTAIELLKKEFKKAIEEERQDTIDQLIKRKMTFTRIPFKMRILSIWNVVFSPKDFFLAAYQGLQHKWARELQNKNYV